MRLKTNAFQNSNLKVLADINFIVQNWTETRRRAKHVEEFRVKIGYEDNPFG
jgi:hypothetical protein